MAVSTAGQETQNHLIANLSGQVKNQMDLAKFQLLDALETSTLLNPITTQTTSVIFEIYDTVTLAVRKFTLAVTLSETDGASQAFIVDD